MSIMRVRNINTSGKSLKPLLGVLSAQVEAAVAEASVDIDGMMARFSDLDSQLGALVAQGVLDTDSSKNVERALSEIVVHLQCFDLLAQKLSHVQNALALLDSELPAEVCSELSRKLDAKVKALYSCSDELNIHIGATNDTSCATSELF